MRAFLIVLCTFSICVPLLAASSIASKASHCVIKLANDSFIWGEHLETYEDRWFYQESLQSTQHYELIFSEGNDSSKSPFKFINQRDIRAKLCWPTNATKYFDYIVKNDLLFKNNLVEGAYVLTGNEGHHKFEAMFGNFAWDIGIVDLSLSQFSKDPDILEDYYVFGAPVVSPLSGVIIGAVTDQEDNPIDRGFTGDLSQKVNNYLTIQTSPFTYLSVVHFKKDSVSLKVGDKIKVGTPLGEVGNSGISYLPHLHYTLYTYSFELERFVSIPGFFQEDQRKVSKH